MVLQSHPRGPKLAVPTLDKHHKKVRVPSHFARSPGFEVSGDRTEGETLRLGSSLGGGYPGCVSAGPGISLAIGRAVTVARETGQIRRERGTCEFGYLGFEAPSRCQSDGIRGTVFTENSSLTYLVCSSFI